MYKLTIKNKATQKIKDEIKIFDNNVNVEELDQLRILRLFEPIKNRDLNYIYNYVDKVCLDFLNKGSIIKMEQKGELSLGESLESILNANYYALQSAKLLKWLKTSKYIEFNSLKDIKIKPHYEILFEKQ